MHEGTAAMKKKEAAPLFITFEGIDGCGKSSQAVMTFQWLKAAGRKVELLREPGSTAVSEKIRELLLGPRLTISDMTELLLYEASRAELVSREIAPLLKKGYTVLCDRFYDSTTAYQGYGRKLDIKMIRALNRMAVGGLVPNLTFLFDVDLKTAARRTGKQKDRLESQSTAFFNRVRTGFLQIARRERRRIKVIDAAPSMEEVFSEVKKILGRKIKAR